MWLVCRRLILRVLRCVVVLRVRLRRRHRWLVAASLRLKTVGLSRVTVLLCRISRLFISVLVARLLGLLVDTHLVWQRVCLDLARWSVATKRKPSSLKALVLRRFLKVFRQRITKRLLLWAWARNKPVQVPQDLFLRHQRLLRLTFLRWKTDWLKQKPDCPRMNRRLLTLNSPEKSLTLSRLRDAVPRLKSRKRKALPLLKRNSGWRLHRPGSLHLPRVRVIFGRLCLLAVPRA